MSRIFPGIYDLDYSVPTGQLQDLSFGELKAVEVTSVRGFLEEVLILDRPHLPTNNNCLWLESFEVNLKNSLKHNLDP